MKKINVFLDDYRKPPDGFVYVNTIVECLELLRTYEIGHLSLDHDLESKRENGMLLVNIMVREKLSADHITVHSANAVGGKAMYKCLKLAQSSHIYSYDTTLSLRPLPLDSYTPMMLKHYQ
ncbi:MULTISPECIES: cyclic-phosphate processing receiver domain-containing protein [Bacillus]|uniref:Cyclic-phosphate processing Receiver domain-containing protein n=1 Tax=Bacillus infantis NRRL B-14911 TaxID=1367477 RepID=U5LHG0_9BACI|nr:MULTISPECIES: cyclic-phosphate processing receiver domain-containing protein [Bacillus]AGX06878.1 hypothetical protein N288_25230 [Bacillus infantis NRRL B-14911]EAR67798.1 hypothetical protein B14911_13577 [Bacillus sp. NRRL B-14911]OXT17885.1 hypothetical protein B9K06_08430 [Bacillus sp. OG2]SIB26605.1 Uncharacterised protein [Mycobacteroides abscessus subsp. abscessus]